MGSLKEVIKVVCYMGSQVYKSNSKLKKAQGLGMSFKDIEQITLK